MNLIINIHHKASNSRITQSDSIPLRGRKPGQVAYQWWKGIKKEMSYRTVLEKQDITELVKELEKQEWEKIQDNWNLPFK